MWIELLKRYWLDIIIALIIVIPFLYVRHLNAEISSLKKDNVTLQVKLNESNDLLRVQNATILANEADYNASMAKLPTVLHKIDTKYVTKTVEIEKWRDKNETSNDCNYSMQYLNNYQF
jgi:ABC-type molybdate transport system ATPase subunit